ncbi:hypothetical protein OAM67_00995 [bacterium]|jgi:hypothetical protein|nr:hypothetical protein [bacterium]
MAAKASADDFNCKGATPLLAFLDGCPVGCRCEQHEKHDDADDPDGHEELEEHEELEGHEKQ